MKMTFRLIGGLMMTVATLAIMGSCVSDKDSSGLEYMPDMYRSPAIEPYVDYAEIQGREVEGKKEQLSALRPPMNTIPYYGSNEEEAKVMLPWSVRPNVVFKETHGLRGYHFTTEDTYNTQALAWTDNAIALTEENADAIFKEGKRLFTNNCVHCHGEAGDGNGPMMNSGAYRGVPNYADKKSLSNGQLFYSIYYGKGEMGAHASILNKREIWTLVHYVRKLQDKKYGTADGEEEVEGAEGEDAEGEENEDEENN